ncbi:MAG: ATP-binding protein [Firmicutes bacterium]|nr:ATP-binding protein [Bacillota bacterium]
MEVYALIGKSGTGKSFQAMNLCKQYNIEAIIDDGLFIYKHTVVEGISAKRVETKIGAVKIALFSNEEIRRKVVRAIKEKKPESILVLGTSDGMVDRIIERLELPPLASDSMRRIRIENITSPEERAMAKEQRDKLGKHVIPAPSLQLKRSFAGYFMDPLRFFRGKDQGAAAERTVVRPTYSYMGEYFLAEKVIDDIVTCVASQTRAISRVIHIVQDASPEAYHLHVSVKIRRGFPIWETAQNFQRQLNDIIEEMTAFNVAKVDVEVRGIS